MPVPPTPRQGHRPVAVVSFAQADNLRRESHHNEVETLMPVFAEVFGAIRTGGGAITKDDIDFICSGSTDYLVGGPFSFVSALDAIGVWPPRSESHVEMDAAWALYEAWVALQDEGVDTALVYGFGKSSLGDLGKILALQLDPYVMAPLWPDPVSLAALQARALIDAGKATEADFAAVAARSRKAALANPKAQVAYDRTVEQAAGRGVRGVPIAHPCPAAGHRRGGGGGAGRRGQGLRVGRAAGLDHRHRPSGGDPLARGP